MAKKAEAVELKRWIAIEDAVLSWPGGQVRHVKAGEIILAEEAPNRHFEPAGDVPGKAVAKV